MLVSVGLLLLLLRVDGGHGAPRSRSSSSRDEAMTRGEDLVTDTESGRVRGIRHRAPHLRRPVDAYLGIPFAKPPLNSLRFRPPQPIEKWRNIYNATRQPNSCYQLHDANFGTDFYVSSAFTIHLARICHILRKLLLFSSSFYGATHTQRTCIALYMLWFCSPVCYRSEFLQKG